MILLGVAGALLCALLTNLGFLFKHQGANDCHALCLRRPLQAVAALLRSRVFMLGWGVGVLGFVCHVVAIASAPLPLVKVILSAGLVFLALMADALYGHRLGRRQWAGLVLMSVGLLAVGLQMPGGDGHAEPPSGAFLAFQAAMIAVGVLALVALRGHRHLGLGIMAGVLWGCGDLTIKFLSQGPPSMLLYVPLLVAMGVLAFILSARAFQGAEAVAVITFSSLAANLGGMVGALTLFSSESPTAPLELAVTVGAIGCVLVASFLVPAPRAALQGSPA